MDGGRRGGEDATTVRGSGSRHVGRLRREPGAHVDRDLDRPPPGPATRTNGTSGIGRVHARDDPDAPVGQLELGPDRIGEDDAAERPDDLGVEHRPVAVAEITFTPTSAARPPCTGARS